MKKLSPLANEYHLSGLLRGDTVSLELVPNRLTVWQRAKINIGSIMIIVMDV